MNHRATTSKSVDRVLGALDKMPKERRMDYVAGKLAPSIVGRRTYTRMDGNRFQVSRTAGFGSDTVCSGIVFAENGRTVINLRTTFGIAPHIAYVILALALIVASIGFFVFGGYVEAACMLVGAACAIGFRVWRFYEAKFLREKIGEQVGGIEWESVADEDVATAG